MPRKQRTDLQDGFWGVCENCNKETWVRRIESFDRFHRGSRGFFNLCYKCFGPRILWRKGGLEMKSPMDIPYDELDDFLTKYFSDIRGSSDSKTERDG